MNDELMSCLTCLRVQRQIDMLTVENPARGGVGMSSFKLCMGCATAVAEALSALKAAPAEAAPENEDGSDS